jgi:hypothetical protein
MARAVEPPSVAVASTTVHLHAAIGRCRAALTILECQAGQLDPDDVAELTVLVQLLARRLGAATQHTSPPARQRHGC